MKKIVILNGPNLNLLGKRNIDVYGERDFNSFFNELKSEFASNFELYFLQSNFEGQLIDWIHEFGFTYDGIVLNAGGYSHTSIALRDAIESVTTPCIEVHISNIYAREEFRNKSMLTAVCRGSIVGFGLDSYTLAVKSFY